MVIRTLDYAGPKTNPRRRFERRGLSNETGTWILIVLAFLPQLFVLHDRGVLLSFIYAVLATIALTQTRQAERWFRWAYGPTLAVLVSLMFAVSECPHQRVVWFGSTPLSITQYMGIGPCGNEQWVSHPLLPWRRQMLS